MRMFVIVGTLSVVVGCATAPSFPQLRGGQRVDQPGISFVAPSGGPWSVLVASTYQISLARQGTLPAESYVVQASIYPLPTFDSKEQYLEHVRNGRAAEPQTGRFELIRNHEEFAGRRQETCVKHQAASKDFGAKRGGEYTVYETYGMNCIHPRNAQVGVFIEISRKAPPDLASPGLEQSGAALLESVQFRDFR